jgi:hypothetical protein
MKKMIIASVAVLALTATPVLAQDAAGGAAVGGTAGGVTGAIAGGLIFGPIGAVIGGFTGAVIGANVVSEASVDYVRTHPTQPVGIDGEVEVGYVVPAEITLHPIEGDDAHGYFYTNDRVYFVELQGRTVVYSPGTVVAAEVEVN